jgi:hypothetical protein
MAEETCCSSVAFERPNDIYNCITARFVGVCGYQSRHSILPPTLPSTTCTPSPVQVATGLPALVIGAPTARNPAPKLHLREHLRRAAASGALDSVSEVQGLPSKHKALHTLPDAVGAMSYTLYLYTHTHPL